MVPSPKGLRPEPGRVEGYVGQRARIVAFDPLVDSADVGWRTWNQLLDLIEGESCTSRVIITHGTDTMAYTGAALSQVLASGLHRVVLCGSMRPLGTGGDAEANIDFAFSADPEPGVWLAFAGRLLPAAGLVKVDSSRLDSFRSIPQEPPSIPLGSRFRKANLAVLTLTPDMPHAMLLAALETLDGAVLRLFGAGTLPENPKILGAISNAVDRGVKLRAVSACESGGIIAGTYASGSQLFNLGVENGGRETPELALIRLWLSISERH
jgi:L-asparaginase